MVHFCGFEKPLQKEILTQFTGMTYTCNNRHTIWYNKLPDIMNSFHWPNFIPSYFFANKYDYIIYCIYRTFSYKEQILVAQCAYIWNHKNMCILAFLQKISYLKVQCTRKMYFPPNSTYAVCSESPQHSKTVRYIKYNRLCVSDIWTSFYFLYLFFNYL